MDSESADLLSASNLTLFLHVAYLFLVISVLSLIVHLLGLLITLLNIVRVIINAIATFGLMILSFTFKLVFLPFTASRWICQRIGFKLIISAIVIFVLYKFLQKNQFLYKEEL